MLQKLSVLFVEDNEDHALLIVRLLKKEGYDLNWLRVETASDMLSALQQQWDLIISDYSMPNFSGSDALQIYLDLKLDMPFILVSGTVGEDIAIKMLKNGAHDYVMKDKLNLIVPAVKREMHEYRLRQERVRFMGELQIAQAIVNNSPVVLWQWSPEVQKPVIYVSDNVRQFGYSPDDFTSGKIRFKNIIHPDDDKLILPLRAKFQKEGKNFYDLEYRIFCKDGSVRWVIDQSTVIRTPEGEIDYIQGLLVDISGRKLAEDTAIASERQFKELMENMELIAVILDNDGKIQFCNQYLLSLTGWGYNEIINQDWFDVFIPKELKLKENVFALLMENKLPKRGENAILTKNKDTRIVTWSNTILSDTSGKTMGVASIGQDVTDRIRFEKELENSQKLYKSLVDTSPDSISLLGLDFKLLFANQRDAEMFGYDSPDEDLGRNGLEYIAPESQHLIQNGIKTLLTTHKADIDNILFVKKDGSHFNGKMRSNLIFDENNNPKSIISFITDISKEKQLQEALEESEVRFRSAFEDAPIGMELISLDGTLMKVNRAFCELTGYSNKEMEKFNFRDFTHPDDLNDNENHVQKLITGESDHVNFVKRYVRKDGKHIWVNVSASIFKSSNGDPQYFIAQVEDITHRKQISDEVVLAKEKAEESDRLKSALLTNMSHELRTPMNGILGFTELIMQSNVLNEIKVMARMIDISGKRLLQTLDSIMLLAQLQSGHNSIAMAKSHVCLSDEVVMIADSMMDIARDKGLEWSLDIQKDIYIELEPKLLRNAVSILIDNAIKYTQNGSVKISLYTDCVDCMDSAFIMIQDTGIGITDQFKESIFEEFRQVSEGYGRNYEGIGIGLSITKKIVELFKGRITVKSTPNVGSTFTIILPLDKSPQNFNSQIPLPTSMVRSVQVAKSKSDTRILIVEDNMVNTKLLVHFLSNHCSMIDCASSGEAAVDLTKTNSYDAILMDINLGSGIDGLQATQIIRKQAGYTDVPIIAVTGYTLIGDKERLLEGGCSHYIGKPFSQESVLRVLRDIFISAD